MREILFRGKALYSSGNHPWIFGDLKYKDNRIREHNMFIDVDPKTIGQFTGLHDRNGTKIFEGDIVKHYIYGCEDDWRKDKFELHLVEWVDECCGFEPFSDSRNNCGHCGGGIDPTWCEVVGNIHDNPELMESNK